MTTTIQERPPRAVRPSGVFSRVLAGVDGSREGAEAARQAAILKDLDGELTLLAVWGPPPPLIGVTATEVPYYSDGEVQRRYAESVLSAAREAVASIAPPIGRTVDGVAWQELILEARRRGDTLIAVGSRGLGRARGILAASTVTELVHKAPCSVLVARKAPADFPRRIVVGVDGSPESAAAYAAGRYLSARFGAELWPVVALGGDPTDRRLVALIVDHDHEELPDEPAKALVVASADADLVIVGSRGLRGVKALGSVSERVAHQARCSTLIVRDPEWKQVREEPAP
jgi:nucleotide-binding universal stress UspA family protein